MEFTGEIDGHVVCVQDGDGYFIPDPSDNGDMNLLKRYVRQEEARLKSIGWSLKAARKTLKGIDFFEVPQQESND